MSKAIKPASAGTLESSDVMVELEPAESRSIELHSVVEQQFGPTRRARVKGGRPKTDRAGLTPATRPCPDAYS